MMTSTMGFPGPPHFTHPPDVGLFKAYFWAAEVELINLRYREHLRSLRDWTSKGAQQRAERPAEPREIRVRDVPILLKDAAARGFTPENIQSAFRKTGIYPLHKEALLASLPRGRRRQRKITRTEMRKRRCAARLRSQMRSMTAMLQTRSRVTICN